MTELLRQLSRRQGFPNSLILSQELSPELAAKRVCDTNDEIPVCREESNRENVFIWETDFSELLDIGFTHAGSVKGHFLSELQHGFIPFGDIGLAPVLGQLDHQIRIPTGRSTEKLSVGDTSIGTLR